jgi:hypothetical protein
MNPTPEPGRPSPEPAGRVDTSVFIAREVERPLGELPSRVAVSVVTIGELQLGLLSAPGCDRPGSTGGHARPGQGGRPDSGQ